METGSNLFSLPSYKLRALGQHVNGWLEIESGEFA